MSCVCFIDFIEHVEICIVNTNNPNLIEYRYYFEFCPVCIMSDLKKIVNVSTTLFYVNDNADGQKIKTFKNSFPQLRITNYISKWKHDRCLDTCLKYIQNV